MPTPLRLLVVEDSPVDTELILRELRKDGFELASKRVDSAEDMAAALDSQPWDLVLSDYSLPQFSGAAALSLFRQRELDIPFILVSGVLGEEVAVEMMKAGAQDYGLKHNLFRLAPAVRRELASAEQCRARCQQEATTAYLASIVSSCQDAIIGTDLQGMVVSWNAGAEALYGHAADDMVGRSISSIIPADRQQDLPMIYQNSTRSERAERFETVRVRKDGSRVEVSLTISPMKDAGGKVVGVSTVALDISKRKRDEAEWMRLIQELTEALAHVKTLSGLLPICASCKKIRDDQGYWQQVETYIEERSDADFTHGICPDCVQRLYPEYKLGKNGDSAPRPQTSPAPIPIGLSREVSEAQRPSANSC